MSVTSTPKAVRAVNSSNRHSRCRRRRRRRRRLHPYRYGNIDDDALLLPLAAMSS